MEGSEVIPIWDKKKYIERLNEAFPLNTLIVGKDLSIEEIGEVLGFDASDDKDRARIVQTVWVWRYQFLNKHGKVLEKVFAKYDKTESKRIVSYVVCTDNQKVGAELHHTKKGRRQEIKAATISESIVMSKLSPMELLQEQRMRSRRSMLELIESNKIRFSFSNKNKSNKE